MLPQVGMVEMLVIMGIAVLLFGKRLPEVGRSLGKGIVEFKKGLSGITEELDFSSTLTSTSSPRRSYDEDRVRSSSTSTPTATTPDSDAAVPKFEPPTPTPSPTPAPVPAPATATASVPEMEYHSQPSKD